MIAGTNMAEAAANRWLHDTNSSAMNPLRNTGRVSALRLDRISPNRNSFQEPRKTKIAVEFRSRLVSNRESDSIMDLSPTTCQHRICRVVGGSFLFSSN